MELIDDNILSELTELKSNISKYNPKLWKKCVCLANSYELVPHLDKIKRISRSFYKLLEIIFKYNLFYNHSPRVLCLCEAPGGFAECIHYIIPQAKLKVQSKLDSYIQFSKKIPKDSIIYESIGKGNIFHPKTKEDIYKRTIYEKFDIITADGGIDCSNNYSKQEVMNFPLIKTEIEIALSCLKDNGVFIFKVYDIHTYKTFNLLKMNIYPNFRKVEIFKPRTSRPCNSEQYFICIGYKGLSTSDITIQQIKEINNNIAKIQIESLKETHTLCKQIGTKKKLYKNTQLLMSKYFLNQFKIPYLRDFDADYTKSNYSVNPS